MYPVTSAIELVGNSEISKVYIVSTRNISEWKCLNCSYSKFIYLWMFLIIFVTFLVTLLHTKSYLFYIRRKKWLHFLKAIYFCNNLQQKIQHGCLNRRPSECTSKVLQSQWWAQKLSPGKQFLQFLWTDVRC